MLENRVRRLASKDLRGVLCQRKRPHHHYHSEEEERPTTMVTTTGAMAQGEGCHYDTMTRIDRYGYYHAGSTTGEVVGQENNDIVRLRHQTD